MNKKKLIFVALLLTSFFTTISSQNYYPFSVLVVDKANDKPISNARISIKEIGYQSETSDANGNVYFEDIPEGEINYIVVCDTYQGVEGSFNITSEVKSNTLKIKLSKFPKKEASMILVSGEVIDTKGLEVENCEVELRAGTNVENTVTDDSGNFNIEFNLDKLKYNINELMLIVKKGTCREKSSFDIPKNNYIYKEIQLSCHSNKSSNAVSSGSINSLNGEKTSMYPLEKIFAGNDKAKIKIMGIKREGEGIMVDFKFFNSSPYPLSLKFNSEGTRINNEGDMYYCSKISFGGSVCEGACSRAQTIAGKAWLKGKIWFKNYPKNDSKVPILEMRFSYNWSYRTLPIRDLEIE